MDDGHRSMFELRAREAAARLDQAREIGAQLSLIPTEASPADVSEIEPRGPGRPKGARNKRTSKLRQMLAARGFRMPEDVLAEVAGLSSRETAVELAMQRAEQVLLWACGTDTASAGQRIAVFLAIWKEQVGAASAMLPYGLERMTPDQGAQSAPTFLVLPGGRADAPVPGDRAKVIDGRMAPPPLPSEIERNQQVRSDVAPRPTDGSRTE